MIVGVSDRERSVGQRGHPVGPVELDRRARTFAEPLRCAGDGRHHDIWQRASTVVAGGANNTRLGRVARTLFGRIFAFAAGAQVCCADVGVVATLVIFAVAITSNDAVMVAVTAALVAGINSALVVVIAVFDRTRFAGSVIADVIGRARIAVVTGAGRGSRQAFSALAFFCGARVVVVAVGRVLTWRAAGVRRSCCVGFNNAVGCGAVCRVPGRQCVRCGRGVRRRCVFTALCVNWWRDVCSGCAVVGALDVGGWGYSVFGRADVLHIRVTGLT